MPLEPVYTPVIGAALALFKAMGWQIRVRGIEHIPATGPAVVATNHVGYLDFTFVGYGVRQQGRLLRFLAKKEIFDHPVAGPLMRGMKHVPVDRFGRPQQAFRYAVEALRGGEMLGMFPEATISRSFIPAAGKSGAARMAMAASSPLVPGAVWGSQRILTKGRPRNFQRNVAITVDFGAPIEYGPDDDPADVTKRLMQSIEKLVDRASREYPQQPAGPHDTWWVPAHLGGTAPTTEEADAMAAQERAARRARREKEEP
ncbi:MAG: 1-acyl-sn-glycerol-3-phosphate acyltransferase [Nitriliruptorales bacterium]|nr:1-acyl-sn-glycerol-3-phosphate acyltransferase [Nitriliruptorales bacterium]